MQEENYDQERLHQEITLLGNLLESEGYLYNHSEIFKNPKRSYSGGRSSHLGSKACVAAKFLEYEDVDRVQQLGQFLRAQYIAVGKKVITIQEQNGERRVSCVNAYFHFNTTKHISFERTNSFMKRCGFYAGTGQNGLIWLQYVRSSEEVIASWRDEGGEYHILGEEEMDHIHRPSKKSGGTTTPPLKDIFHAGAGVSVEPQHFHCKSRKRTKPGRNANRKRVLFSDPGEICTDPKQTVLTDFYPIRREEQTT